ncbi:MAG: hypothetical protein DRG78_03380 [Epsilonproteobacteria bacterium]|nr:MAG: hypothetical protein DRG78_03380 [Campylobacterota bacterium]
MKLKLLLLLISLLLIIENAFAKETHITDYGTYSYHGNAYYTYSTSDKIGYDERWEVSLGGSADYGDVILSAKISTSEYSNYLRRAAIMFPFSIANSNITLGFGRVTNATGLFNTAIGTPSSNGLSSLPVSVYDVSQLEINTNILDGGFIKIDSGFEDFSTELEFYMGQPVLDRKHLDIYDINNSGSTLSFNLEGNVSYIAQGKLRFSDFEVFLKYNRTIMDVVKTKFNKIEIPKGTDDIAFTEYVLGGKYNINKNLVILAEVSSIDYDAQDHNFYGGHILARYAINEYFEPFIGYSRGRSDGVVNFRSKTEDIYGGLVMNYDNFNLLLEYHYADTGTFKYKDYSTLNGESIFLTSITFNF